MVLSSPYKNPVRDFCYEDLKISVYVSSVSRARGENLEARLHALNSAWNLKHTAVGVPLQLQRNRPGSARVL